VFDLHPDSMGAYFLEESLFGNRDEWEHPDDEEGISLIRGTRTLVKTCKFCGEYPLYWYEVWPGHWRLRRSDGEPHKCVRINGLLTDLHRRFK
jgi:hypothetical protein